MRLKKYTRDEAHAYTFGVFPTLELLLHRAEVVEEVLLHTDAAKNEGAGKIRTLCEAQRIPYSTDDKLVERLSAKENTYAVGVFRKYQAALEGTADHVMLVNPADMGNLGTIIRTMLGFGVRNLALIRPAADIFDPRVIRASMGALFQVQFEYFESVDAYQSVYQQHLYPFLTDGQVSLREVRFERPFTLVFGSESSGLPEHFRTMGSSVTIPQSAAIDSLNLATAVAVALYAAGTI